MQTGILTELANFISNCGFPIIVVLYLWNYSKKESKVFAEAIKNNTRAIHLLTQKVNELTVLEKAREITEGRAK